MEQAAQQQQLLAISHASKSHRETIELDSGSPGVASSRCKRRGRRNEGESRSTHMSAHLPSAEEPAPTLPEKSIDRWSRCDRDAACLDDAKIHRRLLEQVNTAAAIVLTVFRNQRCLICRCTFLQSHSQFSEVFFHFFFLFLNHLKKKMLNVVFIFFILLMYIRCLVNNC